MTQLYPPCGKNVIDIDLDKSAYSCHNGRVGVSLFPHDTMPQNILLVDDDPDFRQKAKQSLQDAGYNVTEAEGES